jgi:hypothetical protein
MKTREIREFYKTLSELNNSFTHYSLVWLQFNIDYCDTIQRDPEILTKDYFASNPFKKTHNIRLKELGKEHEKTNKTLIQGIFLLIYSHFESYLKEVLDFSRRVNDTIRSFEEKLLDIENDSMLIDKVFNRLSIDKFDVGSEMIVTLDYFRLKRNRLTHQNSESISRNLRDLITSKGKILNDYWDSILPSGRQEIDFVSKESSDLLTFNIIIDTINIFRLISKKIDNIIIQKLTEKEILEKYIIPEFLRNKKNNYLNLPIERLGSKFARFCETNYSLIPDEEIIESLKGSIA